MNWAKIGFIKFKDLNLNWAQSHLQLPTALPLDSNRVRVFFAARDERQYSHVGFVDLEVNTHAPIKILRSSKNPILQPGPIGHFDEHGVYPSSIITSGDEVLLYFIGWTKGIENPLFYANIGLAKSSNGINFERYSIAPILARSEYDPCLVTSPFVYKDSNLWRMNYVSGIKWDRNEEGDLVSYYHIKYAESNNPVNWRREGRIAIDLHSGETNIARPTVLKVSEDDYRMWYSYVKSDIGKYRIGYATSNDGLSWKRKDNEFPRSLDKENARDMICYPNIFELKGHKYLLYNGDKYGKYGFGIALCKR